MSTHVSRRASVLTVTGVLCVLALLASSAPVAAPVEPAGTSEASVVTRQVSDAVRVRAAGPIRLAGPGSAAKGTRIKLTGTVVVKAKRPRRVLLAERVNGRWRVLGRTTSSRRGAFSFGLGVGPQVRERVFRAQAPAARGVRGVTSPALRVVVTAVEHRKSDDWTYLFDDDGGGRWDPCEPIRWAYNETGEPYPNAEVDVATAVANIAAVSGLPFVQVDDTTYREIDDPEEAFPTATTDIVIAWANPTELADLAGGVVGVGGGAAVNAPPGKDVKLRMVRGFVTLDETATSVPQGFAGSGWGQIMMHEVLHSVGLDHARWFNDQLMWPVATSKNFTFGAGDITGMTKVGLPAGCLS